MNRFHHIREESKPGFVTANFLLQRYVQSIYE